SIPTLFSTGVDDSHNALSPGVPDPHYLLTVSAQSTPPPPPIAATVIQNHPVWLANDALSSWIGPVNPGAANVAPGEYRYRTSFNLSGFDPATAQITLSVAADNRLNDVLINGASSGISFVGFSGFSQDFVITNGFVNGTNTLEFVAFNDATTPNPAGFRARLSGTAHALLPQNTQLNPGPVAAYFRATFTFTGNPTATLLTLRPLVADGAVFYLNGAEVSRLNMPDGAISSSTPASLDVTNASSAGTLAIPSSGIVRGTNVLAVEVHQATNDAGDSLFGAELVTTPATLLRPSLGFNELR